VFALLLLPSLAIAVLLSRPDINTVVPVPIEHVIVVTNVALLALVLALLVARAALELGQYRILLGALGFMAMSGLFAVHGLSTPGVLLRGDKETDAAIVIGVSAAFSLYAAAVFFAIRYTPAADVLARWLRPLPFIVGVVAALIAYAVVALRSPEVFTALFSEVARYGVTSTGVYGSGFGGSETRVDPLPAALGAITILLFLFAAWRQWREYARSRLPTHGALVGSYLFLAQAEVSMLLSPPWAPSWWGYHVLMLGAVVLALGSFFLELDRRRGLERFLPSLVVDRVLHGEPLQFTGERQRATILFADMRGSTALAEGLTPEEVVRVVNDYLGVLARAVFSEGGVLDKFTGDGLMSIFGVFQDGTDGALPALRAAVAMRRGVEELSAARRARGEPTARFGIGIHSGEVVLGTIGIPERSDFTALGDTVNTASRLESLTKEYGVDLVLSDAVVSRLRDGDAKVRRLGDAHVRGKAAPVAIYTVDG
jgi:class 3 adenylate cyclase